MISQTYIKSLELEGKTLQDYFNYVIETEINGQYGQLRELINKMSVKQFKDFLYYAEDIAPNTDFMKFRGFI